MSIASFVRFCFPTLLPLFVTYSLISIAGSDRLTATSRDREERVRRIREQQEDERRKKLEELKEHVSRKGKLAAKINEESQRNGVSAWEKR